jgi:hypothetical protein
MTLRIKSFSLPVQLERAHFFSGSIVTRGAILGCAKVAVFASPIWWVECSGVLLRIVQHSANGRVAWMSAVLSVSSCKS